jgi:glutaredoxin
MPKEIILYTAALCSDCQNLKKFMDAHGIMYESRDIKENPEHARVLEEKTGKLGVPYLVLDGEWVRGYQPHEPFSEGFARRLFGLDN